MNTDFRRFIRVVILALSIFYLPCSIHAADDFIVVPGTGEKLETTSTGTGTSKKHTLKTNGTGGGSGGGPATIADGADVTQGAKADARSTATDTTPVSILSILKQISFSAQNPPSQAVTGPLTDAELRATPIVASIDQSAPGTTNAVAITGAQYTVAIAVATTDGTIDAGKHHVEFILSSDFDGTIQGADIDPAVVAIYNPGDAPVGSTFDAFTYTIAAGRATITTW